jgi:anti-sigma regulatory factor (Ser/Thr protein kinase)
VDQRLLWSHETELAAQAISASRARDFVRGHLAEHDLAHLTDEIQLVVSELVTNALLHAQTPFTVVLRAFEQSVLVEVRDGSPFEPSRVATPHLDTAGRGMTIVDVVSRAWGVTSAPDGGKSVWAAFDRR